MYLISDESHYPYASEYVLPGHWFPWNPVRVGGAIGNLRLTQVTHEEVNIGTAGESKGLMHG